jgi:hypothetical protein
VSSQIDELEMRSQIRFEADPARVRRTGHCPEGSQELAGGAAKRNHRCGAPEGRGEGDNRLVLTGG